MRNTLLLRIAACLLVTPAVGQAQRFTDPPNDTRVRLVLEDSLRQGSFSPARQVINGQWVSATRDSVVLQVRGAAPFGVARKDVRAAYASRGLSRPRSALQAGFVLGSWLALLKYAAGVSNHAQKPQETWIAGEVGFGVGALAGIISPYEHWRRLRK